MEPLRSDTSSSEALSGAERDARIEQLLLSGLDFYFAHNYEQAINLWTRVLFLDRHHDRARAYIERARSAQAERQREAEALLHQGIAAFEGGEVERARRLLSDALDRGASRDLALGILDRIERLVAGHAAPKRHPAVSAWTSRGDDAHVGVTTPTPRRARPWITAMVVITGAIGALVVGVWNDALPDPALWPIFASASPNTPATPIHVDPLPVPSATEAFLARGRVLFNSGHLRDAMREVERIPLGDRLYPEAQRLRADIQRQLLALAVADQGTTAVGASQLPHARPPE